MHDINSPVQPQSGNPFATRSKKAKRLEAFFSLMLRLATYFILICAFYVF